jgi:hypothetical protein
MRNSRRFLVLPLAAILAAGLLAACGDDDSEDPSATATSGGSETATSTAAGGSPTAPGTATASATADPTEAGIAFETPSTLFSKDGTGQEVAVLADVRAARNEGFDRVVIEFEGDEVPGYEVGYVQNIAQCGSGEDVDFGAPVLVSVTLSPASGHTEAGEATVPNQVPTEGTAAVQEVIGFCDFEAVVGYGIGLGSARPYRVFELEGPPRLVIDFSQ